MPRLYPAKRPVFEPRRYGRGAYPFVLVLVVPTSPRRLKLREATIVPSLRDNLRYSLRDNSLRSVYKIDATPVRYFQPYSGPLVPRLFA
jgi:hypothetical protein